MFKTIKCVLILYICSTFLALADDSDASQTACKSDEQLKQKVAQLEKENQKLKSQLSKVEDLKSQHKDQIRHLQDNLEQAKNSVRQYTDKVAQQDKQLSSLSINQEIQKKERAKFEEYAVAKIQALQAQVAASDCPIIPQFVTDKYSDTVKPYVDIVLKHEYTQKALGAYYEHVHPVVQPVSQKVVNQYVPLAVNYSVIAGQKSYEFGVVVMNSPQAQKAKEYALRTDLELQKYILSQMEGIEQVKQYATSQTAMLIVYAMYSTIFLTMLVIFSTVCCGSKKEKTVKTKKPQSQAKVAPKASKKPVPETSTETSATSGKKKSNGAKKGKKY